MIKVFITGTGTGVGKTYVTCNLINVLREAGKSVVGLKPVISGYSEDEIEQSDTACILTALGLGLDPQNVSVALAISRANLAKYGGGEEKGNRFFDLVKWTETSNDADFKFVEGVGGIMVPLSRASTVLDWIVALDFSVLLVGGSCLGSLSHTLSSLMCLAVGGSRS